MKINENLNLKNDLTDSLILESIAYRFYRPRSYLFTIAGISKVISVDNRDPGFSHSGIHLSYTV